LKRSKKRWFPLGNQRFFTGSNPGQIRVVSGSGVLDDLFWSRTESGNTAIVAGQIPRGWG